MKKITVFLIAILFTGALFGQYASQGYRYPVQYGMPAPGTVTGGVTYYKGLTSGRVQVKAPDIAGASTLFQFPGSNGTSGQALITDGNGVLSYLKLIAPTDTAAMLGPYINRADTAAMLAPYINRADTAAMLAHYAQLTEIGSGGYTNLTSFVAQTNWRVFYSNGSGDVTELPLGANNTYLKSNGATSIPEFASIAGGGDVVKVGTPVNNQVGVWTGDGTLEGTSALTFDGTTLKVDTGHVATRKLVADAITASISGAEVSLSLQDTTGHGLGNYMTRMRVFVPDTIQHTSNYTIGAGDFYKDQHLRKATSIVITIPPDLTGWPVGGVMNFYSLGAGITVFKAGSGVLLISPLDSTATARGGDDCSVKKIAANKYKLTGPLTD